MLMQYFIGDVFERLQVLFSCAISMMLAFIGRFEDVAAPA